MRYTACSTFVTITFCGGACCNWPYFPTLYRNLLVSFTKIKLEQLERPYSENPLLKQDKVKATDVKTIAEIVYRNLLVSFTKIKLEQLERLHSENPLSKQDKVKATDVKTIAKISNFANIFTHDTPLDVAW